MNKSMIKIFTLSIALIFAAATGVDAQKIGHMSSQAVFLEMSETKAAQSKLEDYRKQLSSELENRQKALQQKIANARRTADELSPNQIKVLEAEIQEEGQAIETKARELEQQYVAREVELLKPLEEKFMAAIKSVADANGYTYIMETGTLLHAQGGDDITDKVKAKLGM